ncbi:MAG: Lpg1974 family pore-forming outer membrane protein [Parachlamydiales bacterium]
MKRLLSLLLLSTSVSAGSFLPPPCPNARYGVFEIQFDFLYLRTSASDYLYAIEDNRPFTTAAEVASRLPAGRSVRLDPDGALGFRGSLGYLTCRCSQDLTLVYSTLSDAEKEEKTPEALAGGFWPLFAHPRYMNQTPLYSPNLLDTDPARVLADGSFDWDAVELQLGKRTKVRRCAQLRGFASLYYVHLRNGLDTAYEGFIDPSQDRFLAAHVDFDGKTWGVGPRIGFDLSQRIWCGLGVSAHFAGGLLAGRMESKLFETVAETLGGLIQFEEELAVLDHSRAILFPNISGALAVNYTYICENFFAFIAEVGYEYTSYINVVRDPTRYNDQRGTRTQNCGNFDLNGIYVRLKVRM